jgi:hypothetical protein
MLPHQKKDFTESSGMKVFHEEVWEIIMEYIVNDLENTLENSQTKSPMELMIRNMAQLLKNGKST